MSQSHRPIQFIGARYIASFKDSKFYYKAKCQSCDAHYGINRLLETKTWRWHPSYSQMVYGFMCECDAYQYVIGLSPCHRKPLVRSRFGGDFRVIRPSTCAFGNRLILKAQKTKHHKEAIEKRFATQLD